MGAQDRSFAPYGRVSLGSLTTTGANETVRVTSPSGVAGTVLNRGKMSALYTQAEIWLPVGVTYIITTGITVTAAVVQLLKNGVAPNGPSATAALNGVATLPIQALGANEVIPMAAFSDYTFAAADAAGDQWSVKVLTTSTAGVVNPVQLIYAIHPVLGITDGTLT